MGNGNKSAYPVPQPYEFGRSGLTKREVFAKAAMQGLLANPAMTTHDRLLNPHMQREHRGFISQLADFYAEQQLKELDTSAGDQDG